MYRGDDNFHTRVTSYENGTFDSIGLGAHDATKWLETKWPEGRYLVDEPEPIEHLNWLTGTRILQILFFIAQLYLALFL